MDVVLFGSGNVATHLGRALVKAGHRVIQVYSPTRTHAEALAAELGAEPIDYPSIAKPADIYLISVKDDAITAVSTQLSVGLGTLVLHTAGSVSLDALSHHVRRGVLYPVQTFSKSRDIDVSGIPFALEAAQEADYALLSALAGSLSERVFPCSSDQRLALHVAAVFACNFTNHLYAVAAGILERHRLSLDLIRPLILETAHKALVHEPHSIQTGPAVRNDTGTMAKHLTILESAPALQRLYRLISEHILDAHFGNRQP